MHNINSDQIRKLFKDIIFKDKKFFIIVISYSLIVAILNLALPISIQTLISTVVYTALVQPILIISIILFFLLSFAAILTLLQKYLLEIYKRNSFVRLSSQLLIKSIYSDYNDFNKFNTSDLSSRYFEIFNIQRNAALLIVEGVLTVLQIVIGFLLSSFYHPYLLVLNIITLSVIWLTWKLFAKQAIMHALKRSEAKFSVFGWLDDVFRVNKFFRSNLSKNYALTKGRGLIDYYIKTRISYWRVNFYQTVILTILYVIVMIVLFSVGSILVTQGQLSLGQLIASEIIFSTALLGMVKLSNYFDLYYNLLASLVEIDQVYKIPDENILGGITKLPSQSNQLLNFNNVVYEDNFGNQFKFNFIIKEHTINYMHFLQTDYKDIFTKLVLSFIKPKSGHIEFYGVNLNSFNKKFLRDQIITINDLSVFGSTVKEFLTGESIQEDSYVNEILKLVSLDKLIYSMNDNTNAMLVNDDYPFHRSQIILLKIAYAIIAKPRIIVISGLFSQVDSQIRGKIIDYINHKTAITLICLIDDSPSLDLNNVNHYKIGGD
ncbi:MAG: ABC transporter transmembrane domain-containing protein [Neisseriaceae bacterium]